VLKPRSTKARRRIISVEASYLFESLTAGTKLTSSIQMAVDFVEYIAYPTRTSMAVRSRSPRLTA